MNIKTCRTLIRRGQSPKTTLEFSLANKKRKTLVLHVFFPLKFATVTYTLVMYITLFCSIWSFYGHDGFPSACHFAAFYLSFPSLFYMWYYHFCDRMCWSRYLIMKMKMGNKPTFRARFLRTRYIFMGTIGFLMNSNLSWLIWSSGTSVVFYWVFLRKLI